MKRNRIISVKETCIILNCSSASLYRWEKSGILPFRKLKIGQHKVGYRLSDILNYIENQTIDDD